MATPTPEQAKIVDAFKTGDNLVIEAGAGTGKTTTLRMMAEAQPERRGIYIAYNRAIADDAKGSFPSSVQCATAHSFAFRSVGIRYKHRLNGPRVPARQAAQILGIYQSYQPDETMAPFAPDRQARIVMDTIRRFCYSADDEIQSYHVPNVPGLEKAKDRVRAHFLPIARRAWEDIISNDGRLKFEHDHYLKLWAMSNPRLDCEYVLLDEAQDANPVIAQVVENQAHAQKIMVGDRSQAIYGWRGAVDAMSRFEADQRLVLSQSFRFGDAVAVEANKWLNLLEAPLRLSGFDQISSKLETIETPDAILCRTNAEAVAQALQYQEQGKKVALVGGTTEIRQFAEAAQNLMSGRPAYHNDLAAFRTWEEVVSYVRDEDASDLRVMVRLIDTYGPEQVIRIADSTCREQDADIVISTAHKAKGREWNSVRIACDFREPDEGNDVAKPEMMLAYVAVTRARVSLDNAGLQWVDRWIEEKS